ncbi:MAG: adenylate/guanylate cyclase domain-containing protein [Flavobacteriales bacterium]
MKNHFKFFLAIGLFLFQPTLSISGLEATYIENPTDTKIPDPKKKVDRLLKQFDSYFTNVNDDKKKQNKDAAEKVALDALDVSIKVSYRFGEYKSYRNLFYFYKHFENRKKRIKYEFKYQLNKKKLDAMLKEEAKKKEQAKQKAKVEALRKEKERKEAEIRELEKDKNANKALIASKKRELESANTKLTESQTIIEENEVQITSFLDSIETQALINDKLNLENKILEDEKKFIALKEKSARNKNFYFMILAILGALLAVFLIVIVMLKNKSQKELKNKNILINEEKARSDELLLNILPEDLAMELKENGFAKAQSFENVTVFFSDFKDFTKISERLSPKELVEELDYCFKGFDRIIGNYEIEKIKTVGDAYICASGLNKKHISPHDIVRAAIEIREFVNKRIETNKKQNKECFEIRIGIHTGPIVAGVVGFKKFAYDIWGDTVNTAARMEQHSEAGKINVSAKTFELVKSDFSFTYRGKIQAKNKGEIDMYFIHDEV